MGGETLKLELGFPKLTGWDLVAIAVMVVGVVLMGANWQLSGAGGLTMLFVLVQLAICLGSLMILGKTAHGGTLWGNLAAVLGMFVGMGGVLLAAALWAAA